MVLPEELDVRSWLSRMHLGDVLDAFGVQVEGELPRVVEHDRRDALIELQRFGDTHGSHRLAVWIRSGVALRTITRGRQMSIGVSRLQGTIVGARLPCRPGR